ncbi:MAG: hypothetical protein ABIQ16_17940 [Polyangiaceae bacterium]
MLRERWDFGRRVRNALWFVVLVLVVGSLTACTVVASGGVIAAIVGIGALTSHCYDYLDVTVFDAQGRKTCAATVTASRNKSAEHFELESCYYAPLSDGLWTLRATMPGSKDVETVVDVEHKNDCTRHVQSVELTLDAGGLPPRAGSASAISTTIAAPKPVASRVLPQAITPPPPSPAAPSAMPASDGAAGASSDAASAAGSPPVGAFPNQTESSH